jgi:GTPase SAR1 family protein
LTANYVKNLDGVLLVFDLTYRESFDNVLNWYKQIKQFKDIPIAIMGNKSDLIDERIVEYGAM